MKNNLYYFILFSIVFVGCKTEEKTPAIVEKTPTVLAKDVSDVTYRTITLNGEVTDEGFSAATDRGFVYSLSNANPSVSDSKASSGYGKGTYSIILDKLPVNTKYYYRAFSTNSKGTSYSDAKTFNTASITTVTSKTGKVWMDRNLGASQVATSPTDEKAYGDLYQWGRGEDGHQLRTSQTSTTIISSNAVKNSFFITTSIYPYDWQIQKTDNTWQGESGANCPCPTGFRLPTNDEWKQEIETWSNQNATGAFASTLKLPSSGIREKDGNLKNIGFSVFYWTSESIFASVNNDPKPYYLSYTLYVWNAGVASKYSHYRGRGHSVRCIKN
jgi:uncharacterized protein (TIGR02145 family)